MASWVVLQGKQNIVKPSFHMIVDDHYDRWDRWKHSIAAIVTIAEVWFPYSRWDRSDRRTHTIAVIVTIVAVAVLWSLGSLRSLHWWFPLTFCDRWRSFTTLILSQRSWSLRSLAVAGIVGDRWQNENLVSIWSLRSLNSLLAIPAIVNDRQRSYGSRLNDALAFCFPESLIFRIRFNP